MWPNRVRRPVLGSPAMSSARLERLGAHGPSAPVSTGLEADSAWASRMPLLLAGALLLTCLYAAFAHGAVASSDEERVQLVLASIAAVTAAAWLWSGTLRLRAATIVWVAVALPAAFACWRGLTLLWSVAPDQTWTEARARAPHLRLGLGHSGGDDRSVVLRLTVRPGRSSHSRTSTCATTPTRWRPSGARPRSIPAVSSRPRSRSVRC
jgi:hypothetical protein